MAEFSYLPMLSFFVAHEMDAMHRHEWRVLPLTSSLREEAGRIVFLRAHVSLLLTIFGLTV